MSFSKNRILDPVRETKNKRVEFALDEVNSVYLNDTIKLINIGVSSVVSRYNKLAGAKSLIKHARLLNGREVLSSMRYANRYLAFQEFNRPNSVNMSVKQWEARSQNGYKLEADGTDYVINYTDVLAENRTTDSQTTTLGGCVYLSELFPILRNPEFILHTGLFKNLRVEIEYEENLTTVLQHNNVGPMITMTPQIVYDTVVDKDDFDALTNQAMSMSFQFTEIEHDQFIVNHKDAAGGSTTGEKQIVDVKLNAFDNKFINRMLISKAYRQSNRYESGTNVKGAGALGSVACFRETYQFSVNNKQILPDGGWDKENTVQANLIDVYGECDNWGASSSYAWAGAAVDYADVNASGTGSWVGLQVGDLVKNFSMTYGRTVLDDNAVAPLPRKANEELTVHVYAETQRQMMVSNGRYEIVNVSV